MSVKNGLFVGSFDPVHKGHLDIIKRSAQLFDKLYVAIFENVGKQPLLSADQRKELLLSELASLDVGNVDIVSADGSRLTTELASELGVTAFVRSVRNSQDLELEGSLAFFNRQLTGIETVVLLARPEYQYLSSTRVKELASFGGELSPYVSENVGNVLKEIYGK